MHNDGDVKVITIKPGTNKGMQSIIAILSVHMAQIKAEDLAVLDVRVSEDNEAFEILAQKIQEYEIHALPGIVLPTPSIKELSTQRDTSIMLRNYNRLQNTKYNAMMRNYKGRKR